jgi:hypothetical protein
MRWSPFLVLLVLVAGPGAYLLLDALQPPKLLVVGLILGLPLLLLFLQAAIFDCPVIPLI